MDITTIIIAGNEQEMIKRAVLSLSWCPHLVLVAANSTDKTKHIVKTLRPDAKIIETSDTYGRNFDKWRNLGLKQVKTKYLFYLDGDEEVTATNKIEIEQFCNQKRYSYAAVPRNNLYLGKQVHHGGSYPDYQKRLFQTSCLEKWVGQLHEQPVAKGELLHLSHPILHNTHRNLQDMTTKTLIWSDSVAAKLHKSSHPPVKSWRLFRMFFTKFCERYVRQSMWRDGVVGYISSVFESFDTVITYSKLWEYQVHEKSHTV